MLFEKEMLENVEADVHLVATLMTLSRVIPDKTKDTARQVVRKVVNELMKKLANPTQQAIVGSLNRSTRNRRPRHNEINWHATIQKNLKHYQPDYKTIIPETRIGYGRKRTSLKDVLLCLDQSGSMGTSVVYSGIFGSVMASIPAIKTKMIVFDTAVADLTEELTDPVELLFGVQLGGGTDINAALTYCKQIITRPLDTVLVLITDLYEGGDQEGMRKRATELVYPALRKLVDSTLDTYDVSVTTDTEDMRALKNHLARTNEAMKRDITDFIKKNNSLTGRRQKYIDTLLQELFTWNASEENTKTISDSKTYNFINFIKSYMQNFFKTFPNIILNNVDYDKVQIQDYWGLSRNHVNDIKKIIKEYYQRLRPFYSEKVITNILNTIQIKANNLILLANQTPYYSSIKYKEREESFYF